MGQFSTGLYWAGLGDTGGTNPAANSLGMLVLLWFPSPVMYQTRRVSLGTKGTAHLTQADVRQGVSKFLTK